jgi:hypothetical protein
VNATAASSQKTLASPTAAALALTILGPLRTVSESTLALHPMALAQDALVDALGQGVTTLTLGNLYKSKKPSYPTVPHGGKPSAGGILRYRLLTARWLAYTTWVKCEKGVRSCTRAESDC